MTLDRVYLAEEVFLEITEESTSRYPLETGGALLGYLDPENERILQVISQTGPGPKAIHKARKFEPDDDWQTDRIAEKYEESGRTLSYLGDWHSHPSGSSRMSMLDRSTLNKIARAESARFRNPITLIVHDGHGSWETACYCRCRWRIRRVPIERN